MAVRHFKPVVADNVRHGPVLPAAHGLVLEHRPRIPVTGEVHDQIQVDGIFVGSCLIAVAGDYVLGWQWCGTEKKAAWAALLQRFPPPRVVITDGGSGIAAALPECWSETAVRRCLVHVQRKVRANQTWWYTHDRLRKAYRFLERLGRAGTLSPICRPNTPGWISPRRPTG